MSTATSARAAPGAKENAARLDRRDGATNDSAPSSRRTYDLRPEAASAPKPPHSVEAEQGVLGSMLCAPSDIIPRCLD
ncbi:MAG: hypothetical protein M3Q76_13505, partial [Acidobacteriota bacterium]|nr:hypothetical protein [Acidobacteriota bacterium]